MLVPGLVVWHRKQIIHTQNNCIKITLGIWLKLTKPRKLRIQAESVSLTHPRRAWYGSSGGTWDPLAAAAAASNWAALPSPIPGTLAAVPPPPGQQWPVFALWNPRRVRQGYKCNAALFCASLLTELGFLPCHQHHCGQSKICSESKVGWGGICPACGQAWDMSWMSKFHVVPGFDLPLICFVWLKCCSQKETQPRQRLPAHAGNGARPQRLLEGTPAPREADGPPWNLSGKNRWPRKCLLMFSLWIALLWGDRGQEVSRGHRLLSLELRGGEELTQKLCQRAPLSQDLQPEEATLHIETFVPWHPAAEKWRGSPGSKSSSVGGIPCPNIFCAPIFSQSSVLCYRTQTSKCSFGHWLSRRCIWAVEKVISAAACSLQKQTNLSSSLSGITAQILQRPLRRTNLPIPAYFKRFFFPL